MKKPVFTLLFMEPERDQPPVTNYALVPPLGWDACALTLDSAPVAPKEGQAHGQPDQRLCCHQRMWDQLSSQCCDDVKVKIPMRDCRSGGIKANACNLFLSSRHSVLFPRVWHNMVSKNHCLVSSNDGASIARLEGREFAIAQPDQLLMKSLWTLYEVAFRGHNFQWFDLHVFSDKESKLQAPLCSNYDYYVGMATASAWRETNWCINCVLMRMMDTSWKRQKLLGIQLLSLSWRPLPSSTHARITHTTDR